MGKFDAITAAAGSNAGGQTITISNDNNRSRNVQPVTVTRLPGEDFDTYMNRVHAVQKRMELAQQRQEEIEQRQQEQLLRQEQHEAKIRQENTETAQRLYRNIFSFYDPNSAEALMTAQSQLSGIRNFYTFNLFNKDFDMYDVNKLSLQTDRCLYTLEKGETNNSYVNRPSSNNGKNYLGAEYQNPGERDLFC